MECTNPILSPFMDRARENQQRLRESLMSSHPEIVREQTVDCLNVIMFFDSGISIEESKILNEARKIITSKGLPR